MEREPGSFDWGTRAQGDGSSLGADDSSQRTASSQRAAAQPGAFSAASRRQTNAPANAPAPANSFDEQFLTGEPSEYNPFEAKVRRPDESVSFDPDDLGFTTTYVARKSFARRLVGPIVFLVIFGGLIVGATLGADNLARDAVGGLISSKISSTLKLDSGTDPEVDLGEGLFIFQAIGGTIDDVTIDVENATFGGLTGALRLEASGVPTTPSQPTDDLAVSFALDEASSTTFGAEFSPSSKSVITLGNGEIIVATKARAAGQTRLFTVAFTPSAVEGALILTPTSVALGDNEPVTTEEFLESRYAKAGAKLVQPRTVCVASNLPETLTLTGVSIAPSGVTIAASGENVRLSGDLNTLGICG